MPGMYERGGEGFGDQVQGVEVGIADYDSNVLVFMFQGKRRLACLSDVKRSVFTMMRPEVKFTRDYCDALIRAAREEGVRIGQEKTAKPSDATVREYKLRITQLRKRADNNAKGIKNLRDLCLERAKENRRLERRIAEIELDTKQKLIDQRNDYRAKVLRFIEDGAEVLGSVGGGR